MGSASGARRVAFVLERDEFVRRLLVRLIQTAGFQVECGDGVDDLRRYVDERGAHPDVIVTEEPVAAETAVVVVDKPFRNQELLASIRRAVGPGG